MFTQWITMCQVHLHARRNSISPGVKWNEMKCTFHAPHMYRTMIQSLYDVRYVWVFFPVVGVSSYVYARMCVLSCRERNELFEFVWNYVQWTVINWNTHLFYAHKRHRIQRNWRHFMRQFRKRKKKAEANPKKERKPSTMKWSRLFFRFAHELQSSSKK